MHKRLLVFLKTAAVFVLGGFTYGALEVVTRGFTHISMGLLGGAAMCLLHFMNGTDKTPLKIFVILSVSASFITACEYVTGEIVNVRLGLGVWDYSMVPLNVDGQICLPFSLLWFALSAVGLMFDDLIRIKLFGENKAVLFTQIKNSIE